MKIQKTAIKAATPWNVTLARLQEFEHTIAEGVRAGLEARWLFGVELLRRRVEYKGKLGIPQDLMKLTIEQCKVSQFEVNKRVQFAEKYPTKKLMCDAITHYPSWYQMTHEGLIEKPRVKKARAQQRPIRKLVKQIEHAFAQHGTLTRDEVKDCEQAIELLTALLAQIDRNDTARAS